jgi:hypothetical protein
MAEVLDNGHVITDEDVDTARLIMELDRALGRTTDARTERLAALPSERVRSLLAEPVPSAAPTRANGHPVSAADPLVQTLTSQETSHQLAREVADQLPPDLDPAEQAAVAAKIEDVIRRRMIRLVAEARPGH